jgi:heat-inducible transcriptional repressor
MELSEREQTVLSALVRAYVGEAGPVGSTRLSHTLPVKLSSASIRATMTHLMDLGLIEQPHTSAGRVPTEAGLRLFVDQLLEHPEVGPWQQRAIRRELGGAASDASLQLASDLLSQLTRQVGFAVLPRLDRVALRHLSLIRVSSERVLVVLVSRAGVTYQRFIRDSDFGDQRALERLEAELNRRIAGHTLPALRGILEDERAALRDRARVRLRAMSATVDELEREARVEADVLVAGRTPLLDQPEFRDPERLRGLLEALETRETLLAFVDRVLESRRVAVTFGGEVDAVPELRNCAVVSAGCTGGGEPLGLVGVLGPSRMDYPRVVSLVELLSELVSEKLAS